MALHTKLDVLTQMRDIGVIPVFHHAELEIVKNVVAACADGGAKVVEFVNRGDRSINLFTELAAWRAVEKPELILGAGSIVDAPTAAQYINAGADFIVAPVLDEETAYLCNTRKIPYSPGCGSLTEINRSHRLGVDICKLFPAQQIGGPAFVKAVRAPIPWVDIMPTGGVTAEPDNLKAWFDAGVACVGMGSKLISKDLLAKKDFDAIRDKVAEVVKIIEKIR